MKHDLPVVVTEERGRIVELNETYRLVGLRTPVKTLFELLGNSCVALAAVIRVGVKCCCLVTVSHGDVDVSSCH